jgi:hypothetical protein
MKPDNKETPDKLGFLLSIRKPIAKKQKKVISMLTKHSGDFSHYMTLDSRVNWWNSLNPIVRKHPDCVVLGLSSSTNYSHNHCSSISANGIKQRSEAIGQLLECKIHRNHKSSLFDWVTKVYNSHIKGTHQSGYFRNNVEGWIHLLCKDRIPTNIQHSTYITNPWVFESDWDQVKVNISQFMKLHGNAFRYFMDGCENLQTGRNHYARSFVRNETIQEKWEAAMDRIYHTAPMHWSRHLDNFHKTVAFRKFPEGDCIGIELEFVSENNAPLATWDSDDYPTSRWNSFTTDGSITTDCQDEAVARYQEYKAFLNINNQENWDKVQNTLKLLTDAGGRINKSCGCHVHIDMRNRPSATYYRIAGRVRDAFKSWLHRTISPRRATNRYCSVWADSQASRYSAINTHCHSEHNTVEVRVGMPTLNFWKLKMWASLMFWCVNNSTKIDTFEDFMESECPLELKVYVIERIGKFKPLWEKHLANNSHCGAFQLPTINESTPTWDKWVNVVSAIDNIRHEYTSDHNLS